LCNLKITLMMMRRRNIFTWNSKKLSQTLQVKRHKHVGNRVGCVKILPREEAWAWVHGFKLFCSFTNVRWKTI
jgi:hypothetical protein